MHFSSGLNRKKTANKFIWILNS